MREGQSAKFLKYAGSREMSTGLGLISAALALVDVGIAALAVALGAVLSWVIGVLARRRESRLVERRSERFINVTLAKLGKSLELASHDAQWRLGFYEQNLDGSWARLGRYCPDRRFTSGGRMSIPPWQGVLRDAIAGSDKATGRTEAIAMPSYQDSPEEWIKLQVEQGIASPEATSLRFHPCAYVARVFALEVPANTSRVVAFVAESESQSILQRLNIFETVLTRDIAELAAITFKHTENIVLTELDY